jgi:hypothetical protein
VRSLAEIARLRSGECVSAADVIPQLAAGERTGDLEAETHVARCLRCQAEVAAFGGILRAMRAMRYDSVDYPAASLDRVLETLRSSRPRPRLPGWAATAAYCCGLTATAAAGALLWASRRHPGLLNAG